MNLQLSNQTKINYEKIGHKIITLKQSNSGMNESYKWMDLNSITDIHVLQLLEMLNKKETDVYWTIDYLKERLLHRIKKYYVLGKFDENNKLIEFIAGYENQKQFWYSESKTIEIIVMSSNAIFREFIQELTKLGYEQFNTVSDNKKADKIFYYLLPIHNKLVNDEHNIQNILSTLCITNKKQQKKFDINDYIITDQSSTLYSVKQLTEQDFAKVYELYTTESNRYQIFDIYTKEELYDQLFKNKYIKTYVFFNNEKIIDFISCYLTFIVTKDSKTNKYVEYSAAFMYLHSNNYCTTYKLVNEALILLAKNDVRFAYINGNMHYNTIVDVMNCYQIKSNIHECYFNTLCSSLLEIQKTVKLPVKQILNSTK